MTTGAGSNTISVAQPVNGAIDAARGRRSSWPCWRSRAIVARTETVAACPLTLAMNFTEEVRPGARLAAPRLPWPAGFAALGLASA